MYYDKSELSLLKLVNTMISSYDEHQTPHY